LLDEWERRLEAVVIGRGAGDDGSHDIGHCRRVWRVARQIAGGLDESVDLLVPLAAAYLHDIVSLEKNDPRRAEASRMAAGEARIVLSGLDFPRDKLDAVAHAIEAHSYSAKVAPLTSRRRSWRMRTAWRRSARSASPVSFMSAAASARSSSMKTIRWRRAGRSTICAFRWIISTQKF
jgi:HD superfamily phosphodiesterase